MLTVLRILIILLILTGSTVLVSILWPRITTQKPPTQIIQIREAVSKTKQGQRVFEVLGVSTDKLEENQDSFTQNLFTNPVETIKKTIENSATQKGTEGIIDALRKLPENQQQDFKGKYCQ